MSSDSESDDYEEPIMRKVLPKRSTRGKRITDAHKEGDDEFYGQEFFQELEGDKDYESESESEDVVDSDFDITEDESEEEVLEVKETKKRKRGAYVDPAMARKKVKVKATPEQIAERKAARKARQAEVAPRSRASMRSSTRGKTEQATKRLERHKEAKKRRAANKTPVQKIEMYTQEEQLLHAQENERINAESLAELLRIEEQKKAVLEKPKIDPSVPRIRYSSNGGQTLIGFRHYEPSYLYNRPEEEDEPDQSKITCTISGEPAKYLDPRTNKPFASVEAFREIRGIGKKRRG